MLFSLDSGVPVIAAEDYHGDIETTLCFTGHRENSIVPYKGNPIYRIITVRTVQLMLMRYIDMAVESGYRSFISGLAEGTDLWAAKYILVKKRSDSSIKLIGVMPYLRHAQRFAPLYKESLADVERGADVLLTTNTDPDIIYGKKGAGGNTSPDVYRLRNYFMADNAAAVISYFNEGSFKSGTFQTLNYAARQGRKIRRFGLEDVYAVIDECGPDIVKIRRRLVFMKNVFEMPY
ncbi:SLOG family protein [Ruminococcus flavefaciens]|uniref:SLOG family protein n=1 Tax=Ruminococcus flavefaciens TaxID=1265 RepID=UPI001569E468|nr:SLOG family protein [Ruminococcus flavefaciens]